MSKLIEKYLTNSIVDYLHSQVALKIGRCVHQVGYSIRLSNFGIFMKNTCTKFCFSKLQKIQKFIFMHTIYKPVRLAIAATRWKASDRSSTFAALLPDAKARGDQDCLCLLLLRIYFVLNWKLQAIVYRVFFFTSMCL